MSGAGERTSKVSLWKRGSGSDGGGGKNSAYVYQFTRRAEFTHLHGGESVMANRLEGKHTQVVTLLSSAKTKEITTGWQLKDEKTGTKYNIRDITRTTDRKYIELLCESGVA